MRKISLKNFMQTLHESKSRMVDSFEKRKVKTSHAVVVEQPQLMRFPGSSEPSPPLTQKSIKIITNGFQVHQTVRHLKSSSPPSRCHYGHLRSLRLPDLKQRRHPLEIVTTLVVACRLFRHLLKTRVCRCSMRERSRSIPRHII